MAADNRGMLFEHRFYRFERDAAMLPIIFAVPGIIDKNIVLVSRDIQKLVCLELKAVQQDRMDSSCRNGLLIKAFVRVIGR